MNDKIITPKTKVLDLIETYPQLEDVLIAYVPAFKKLKNPILRKSVAKIATLQQAASIGNVKIEDLINILRKEVGQDLFTESQESTYHKTKPDWFSIELIEKQLDARPMLANGEHPVGIVISDLQSMEGGKIYKLIAPFLPAPLIDKATSIGFEHWIKKDSDDIFEVFFYRK